jgi:hypothetical protein
MSRTRFTIKPFPSDGKYWRVDWLGKIHPNPNVDSEPLIDVHLTQLRDDYTDCLQNNSLILKEQKPPIPVGIGALPLISMGSVWKDKKCHEILRQDRKSLTFRVDTSKLINTTFSGQYDADHGIYRYISDSYYPVNEHIKAINDAPLHVVPVTDSRLGFKCILIPQIELFRFYYVCSSFVAKCVWNDDLSRAINQEKSELLEGNDLRIYLRKNLYDHESWLLGRWFLSKTMRSQISRMVRKSRVDAINTSSGRKIAVHPHVSFPFDGVSTLTTYGKRIRIAKWNTDRLHSHEEWAFLVLRIQSCSYPLPFRDIVLERENNNLRGLNKDNPDLESALMCPHS